MNTMKKIISIILCICAVLALASCAAKPDYTKIYQNGNGMGEDDLFADREALTAFLCDSLERVADAADIEEGYSYWEWRIFVKDEAKGADVKKITENLKYASVSYIGEGLKSIDSESELDDVVYISVSINYEAVVEHSADELAGDIEAISANKAAEKIVLSRVTAVSPA